MVADVSFAAVIYFYVTISADPYTREMNLFVLSCILAFFETDGSPTNKNSGALKAIETW